MADRRAAGAGTLEGKFREGKGAWLAALGLLAIALLARLPGFDGRPLFVDELWRALLILDPQFLHNYLAPTVESAITSPIYVGLVKIAAAFSITPDTLRLPSLLSGLLACLLAFALTRKVGGALPLCFLAGLIFALNGNFIAYSNQMKPYTFEACVHLACLYAWLETIASPSPAPRTWIFCFSVLTLAIFSTPTSVFLLPAFGLSFFATFLIRKDMKNLAICSFGFAGLGVLVLAFYYFSWRHGASKDMLSIWSDGFAGAGESYSHFLASRFLQMWQAAIAILVVEPWLAALALALLAVTLGWSLLSGAIRRAPFRNILLFYILFFFTLCLTNALRLWPLGALRPNLFLYGHMIMLLCLLVAQVPFPRRAVQICVALGLLVFLLEAHAYASKLNFGGIEKRLYNYSAPIERSDLVAQDFSYDGPIGKTIAADCSKQKTTTITEGTMAMAIRYYTKFDAAHRQGAGLLDSNCVRLITAPEAYSDPAGLARTLTKVLPSAPTVWFVYTHLDADEIAALQRVAGQFGKIHDTKAYHDAGYFALTHAGPPLGN